MFAAVKREWRWPCRRCFDNSVPTAGRGQEKVSPCQLVCLELRWQTHRSCGLGRLPELWLLELRLLELRLLELRLLKLRLLKL